MTWSYNEEWMVRLCLIRIKFIFKVTGDQGGEVKYWQSNMNNVKVFRAHDEVFFFRFFLELYQSQAVRDLKFSRTDQKMVTCSDEVNIKIWDFATTTEEGQLEGHGWDVKCVDWHPVSSLIVSGSKDNLVKIPRFLSFILHLTSYLWDAKSLTNVATLHGHKNTVVDVEFNRNTSTLLLFY